MLIRFTKQDGKHICYIDETGDIMFIGDSALEVWIRSFTELPEPLTLEIINRLSKGKRAILERKSPKIFTGQTGVDTLYSE